MRAELNKKENETSHFKINVDIVIDSSKMFKGLNTYKIDKDSDLAKMTNSRIILKDSKNKT